MGQSKFPVAHKAGDVFVMLDNSWERIGSVFVRESAISLGIREAGQAQISLYTNSKSRATLRKWFDSRASWPIAFSFGCGVCTMDASLAGMTIDLDAAQLTTDIVLSAESDVKEWSA